MPLESNSLSHILLIFTMLIYLKIYIVLYDHYTHSEIHLIITTH